VKPVDLTKKSLKDLEKTETELRKKYFELKMKHKTGQLKETAELKKVRRNIARTLTEASVKQAASSSKKEA